MADKIKMEDIVVLQYASNTCYTQIVELKDAEEKVDVNLERKVWTYTALKDRDANFKNIKIGKARSPYLNGHEYRDGVIGVYDRRQTEHLDQMVHDANEAVRERHSALED